MTHSTHGVAMTELTEARTKRYPQFALTVTCPSAPGQVAAMVRFLDEHGCYIDEFNVFDDDSNARFFVRCIFHATSSRELQVDALQAEFVAVAQRFAMVWP